METIRYIRALSRSWWLVLLMIVAGGAGGFLVYHRTTPLYSSSLRMSAAPAAHNLDPVSAAALATQHAQVLAQDATTDPALQDALKAAGVTANDTLSVSASSDTAFLTISVSDSDAGLAQKVAAAYAGTIDDSATRISGASGTPFRLVTINSPVVAGSPYAPDWKRDIGIGLAAGLVLGLAIAVLRETFNRTVRDSDALRDLTGLTVLGTVPHEAPKKLLPARSDPRSSRAEAYRQIRTTLLSRTTRRPLVIAVTSASLGEGKTSVAANVAAIFSRAGHRTALIDADLRRPRVHKFYEITPQYGLSEVLTGVARLDEALVEFDDGKLAVLTCGRIPADPAELLGSQAMIDVLDRLSAEHEFVIVDLPPVLPVTDALVIAPLVDGMVMVSKLQGTTDDRILRALEGIDRVNGHVLGIVPNQARVGADRDYSYAYRYTATRRRTDRDAPPAVLHERPADPADITHTDPETLRRGAQVRASVDEPVRQQVRDEPRARAEDDTAVIPGLRFDDDRFDDGREDDDELFDRERLEGGRSADEVHDLAPDRAVDGRHQADEDVAHPHMDDAVPLLDDADERGHDDPIDVGAPGDPARRDRSRAEARRRAQRTQQGRNRRNGNRNGRGQGGGQRGGSSR